MISTSKRWLRFAGALVAVGFVVALLHVASPYAPGAAGRTYRNNTEHDIDARALLYTEIGSVSEFLDAEHGRYGAPQRPRASSSSTAGTHGW